MDVVAGPDAYRDLPRLIASVAGGSPEGGEAGEARERSEGRPHMGAMNVQLSADETYADIIPVRRGERRKPTHVSPGRVYMKLKPEGWWCQSMSRPWI